MSKKATFQLSLSFLIIIIICIVVFSFSIYMMKKFFSHAETIKLNYDERTEKEIERLLDDGSRIAIPFDKKTIGNGQSKTFGIGILNMVNKGPSNFFNISIRFNKAYDKGNNPICEEQGSCGSPNRWLQSTSGTGKEDSGISIVRKIRNYEQEKFLLGVNVKNALSGTYIFDLNVKYLNGTEDDPENQKWNEYDTLHKLYVDVP